MNIKVAYSGRYYLQISGGERGEIDCGWHKNIILNAGINAMLNKNYPLSYIHVGSGSSTPNENQVQLDAKFAHTSRKSELTRGYVTAEDSDTGKAYGYNRFKVQFDKGAAKGNIAEIGVGSNTAGNPLWSRSLILDKKGLPTTITVLEDEFLTVVYEVRRYVEVDTSYVQLEYDDDGKNVVIKCGIVPSTSTSHTGWGSAGLYPRTNGFQPQEWYGSIFNAQKVENNVAYFTWTEDIDRRNQTFSSVTVASNQSGSLSDFLIPAGTKFTFDPPITKTNEFEWSITVAVAVERA
ncbi:MAG: hypothetical protein GX667_02985 [Xanthomonadaceae bacterium]|nr:hypothetical protein [Xanthomonadaceae bacterium]